MKNKDKSPEETWDAYLTSNPDTEWMASLEFLPPDAQEDLIMAYYFLSFTRIN